MDPESADYCDQLVLIFQKAGWNVMPIIRTSLNDLSEYLSVFITGENLKNG